MAPRSAVVAAAKKKNPNAPRVAQPYIINVDPDGTFTKSTQP
jgi:hypothetical protein